MHVGRRRRTIGMRTSSRRSSFGRAQARPTSIPPTSRPSNCDLKRLQGRTRRSARRSTEKRLSSTARRSTYTRGRSSTARSYRRSGCVSIWTRSRRPHLGRTTPTTSLAASNSQERSRPAWCGTRRTRRTTPTRTTRGTRGRSGGIPRRGLRRTSASPPRTFPQRDGRSCVRRSLTTSGTRSGSVRSAPSRSPSTCVSSPTRSRTTGQLLSSRSMPRGWGRSQRSSGPEPASRACTTTDACRSRTASPRPNVIMCGSAAGLRRRSAGRSTCAPSARAPRATAWRTWIATRRCSRMPPPSSSVVGWMTPCR
mmetsp:Transcript_75715/g.219906  ORF Transcript_75715/g.219906 Transcript_75715/m.219906 type:complete len:310 (+) Transcript_75715:2573-3502(+)